jgi:molybdopterin-guanine dinucleotide biosynthesis protein A
MGERLVHARSAVSNSSTHSSDLTEWKRRIAQTSRLTVTAVLLVGGESRRMGTDKSTILCRGKPLWQNQIETLRKLQPKELFVSARSDPAWRPNDIQFVADIPPSRGPLSGLAACLDRMKTTHLLALAIDMPWMTCEYLEFLCAQMGPACGAVPKIASRAEPLGAIYPREAATEFRNALRGTDFSLQSLIRELVAGGKLREIVVTEQHKSLFLNVNEPADLLEGGADGIDLA